MTQVQQLRQPIAQRPTTPQCQAQRINRYYSDRPGVTLPQCEHSSSYVIEGRHLCKRHAGDAALTKLLEMSGELTEADLAGWAARHDIQGNHLTLRVMVDDARSMRRGGQ